MQCDTILSLIFKHTIFFTCTTISVGLLKHKNWLGETIEVTLALILWRTLTQEMMTFLTLCLSLFPTMIMISSIVTTISIESDAIKSKWKYKMFNIPTEKKCSYRFSMNNIYIEYLHHHQCEEFWYACCTC
jgi:hypothetical protein